MSIKMMQVQDIDRVVQLEKELFDSPWSKQDLEYELLANSFAHYYVLVEKEQIIGYIGTWLIDKQCQITTLGIAKDFQRQGYASKLMNHVLNQCKNEHFQNINLEVRVSNHQAIGLYEKSGFKKITVRKDYYANHEDAYLMMKELEG